MSVFEDLIEELKEENLIEETVIETSRMEQNALQAGKTPQNTSSAKNDAPIINNPVPQENSAKVIAENPKTTLPKTQPKQIEDTSFNTVLPEEPHKSEAKENNADIKQPVNENEFYRRRATEEVTSLQIVEHIVSGVEREQMKISPKSYDDIAVGMALHDFLQITSDAQSAEHSLAEFKLMQETESWYSALSHRDRLVSVGDLRRYCESTRPALSSQALIALARFYRNSPFSDAVRSKFDMVMTRLVTKELKNDIREMLFERSELIEHLSDLYADWSSIPLYAPDDDSEVLIAVLKFEDFINEAKEAATFEQLVKKDFFNRLRIFKDSTGENFFSPLLTATAIECNVNVGNRYVELVNAERESNNSDVLEEKYKILLDPTVSDVTSKTLQLIKLLKGKKEEVEEDAIEGIEVEEKVIINAPEKAKVDNKKESKFVSLKINKWLILTALLVLASVGGLYIWVEYFASQPIISPDVKKVSLEDSSIKEYFKTARINKDTYYAITQPAWEDLPKDIKEDILRKILADGAKKGFAKIHLLNGEGKTVGFASEEKGIELSGF